MTQRVWLSAPDVGELEERAVVRALRSGWVSTTGPDVEAFENAVAKRVGVRYAVAVSSGTAALHLALLCVGVAAGDAVLVPTLTFAATANAVVYTGAQPIFVDSEPGTGNVDVELIAALLSRLKRQGRRVGAVMTVDLFGRCADYDDILQLSRRSGVPVIEDAAEALGATYRGRCAGSFGSCGVFSFNGNKIITASAGGMLLTSNSGIARHARYLAAQAREPVAHYEHTHIGYNYRLSNLLAALGLAQLGRLDSMMVRRRRLRDRYTKLFAPVDGVRILGDAGDGSNCWVTAVIVDPNRTGWAVDELGNHLAERGIETRQVWKPMHRQPVFAGAEHMVTGVADRLFETGLVLPSGSVLDDAAVDRTFDEIHRFLEARR